MVRILRVNHAGEHGAIRIYGAQVLATRRRHPAIAQQLSELQSHEIAHCRQFREAMPERGGHPCRALWLWSRGGWLLGFVTALLGPRAIWACTEAVEETVHEHLSAQIAFLRTRDPELHALIAAIRAEEEGHLQLARQEKHGDTALTRAIEAVIRRSVHALVWLSTQGDSTRMRRDLEAAA